MGDEYSKVINMCICIFCNVNDMKEKWNECWIIILIFELYYGRVVDFMNN